MQALKVLLPVDFSEASTPAYTFLQTLARQGADAEDIQGNLNVTLLHIVSSGLLTGSHNLDALRLQVQQLASRPALAGLSCTALVQTAGDKAAGTTIGQAIGQAGQKHDLIVALRKPRSTLQKLVQGTELLRILRHAQCPVLCLTPAHVPRLSRLVFATDFSVEAANVLLRLLPLLHYCNASVYLVQVSSKYTYETTRSFRARCRMFNEELGAQSLEVLTRVADYVQYQADELAQGIVYCAEDLLADAIILATRGQTGVNRWLNGSVTDDVLAATDMPVLVFPLQQEG